MKVRWAFTGEDGSLRIDDVDLLAGRPPVSPVLRPPGVLPHSSVRLAHPVPTAHLNLLERRHP